MTVRVAICQLHCVDDDREGNLRRIDEALAESAARGADLACFPETSILGWVNPLAHELADPIPGPTTERLGAMAREHELMVAIGLAEMDGERLFDSAVLLDRNGELLLKRRKVNILSELMDPPYTPGLVQQSCVADTPVGRIGMLICADTFKDDIVAAVTAQDPDLLIVPYGWAAEPEDWPEHGQQLAAWVAHTARRVGCPVIGVDVVGAITHGPWTGFTYGGQSIACDREGTELIVLGDRRA